MPDLTIAVPIGTLIAVLISFAWNSIKVERAKALIEQLRENDMHDLVDRLDRIENKLDQHLLAHAK